VAPFSASNAAPFDLTVVCRIQASVNALASEEVGMFAYFDDASCSNTTSCGIADGREAMAITMEVRLAKCAAGHAG